VVQAGCATHVCIYVRPSHTQHDEQSFYIPVKSSAHRLNMPSLKRTRSGSQDSSRIQKRSCSNPSYESSAELTQYAVPDDSYMSEASEPSSEPFPQHVPGLCIHKQANACSLWMELCCACADKRPISMRYLAYVDGDGYTASPYRAGNYCDGCRGMFQISHPFVLRPRLTQNQLLG
jgi:hypothetical protein